MSDRHADPAEDTASEPAREPSPRPLAPRALFRPGDGARVLLPILLYKLGFALLVYLMLALVPGLFDADAYFANFQYPRGQPPTTLSRLAAWDGQHYLFLSQEGYKPNMASTAFYPMVPLLLKVGGALFGGRPVVGGLILLNLMTGFGYYIFFAFVRGRYGEDIAETTLLLLMAYPGAMFFQFIYSEAPFLFFVSLFFYGLQRDNLRLAAGASFFLPLCRAMGVFSLLPFAWYLWMRWRRGQGSFASLFACLAPLAGWGLYFLIMAAATGDPFIAFGAGKFFRARGSMALLVDIPGFLSATFSPTTLHAYLGSLIDRVWMLPLLVGLPFLWKKDKALLIYCLPMIFVPAMVGRYSSFTRYATLALPIFIVYGRFLAEPKRRLLKWVVLGWLGSLQSIFLLRYLNNLWAG